MRLTISFLIFVEPVEETVEDIQIEDQYAHLEESAASLSGVQPAMEEPSALKAVDFQLPVQGQERGSIVGRTFGLPAALTGASSIAASSMTLSSLTSQTLSSTPSSSSSSSSSPPSLLDRLQPLASLPPVCVGGTSEMSMLANGSTVSHSGAGISEVSNASLPPMTTLNLSLNLSFSTPQQQHHPHLQHAPLPSFLHQNLAMSSPSVNFPSSQATMLTSSSSGTGNVMAALAPLQNLHCTPSSMSLNPSHTAGAATNIPSLPSFQMPIPPVLGAGLHSQMAHAGALLPTMYPYPGYHSIPGVQNLPTQPIPSSIVRVSAPGFPAQTLVSGYPSYLQPAVYENPPVTSGNYTTR